LAAVKGFFPPELLNRFDDVIVFNPLTTDSMRKIFATLICDLQERVKEETKLKL
jgi:ATP-dependent Clp protease ATP-binding subunit ClpA